MEYSAKGLARESPSDNLCPIENAKSDKPLGREKRLMKPFKQTILDDKSSSVQLLRYD